MARIEAALDVTDVRDLPQIPLATSSVPFHVDRGTLFSDALQFITDSTQSPLSLYDLTGLGFSIAVFSVVTASRLLGRFGTGDGTLVLDTDNALVRFAVTPDRWRAPDYGSAQGDLYAFDAAGTTVNLCRDYGPLRFDIQRASRA